MEFDLRVGLGIGMGMEFGIQSSLLWSGAMNLEALNTFDSRLQLRAGLLVIYVCRDNC